MVLTYAIDKQASFEPNKEVRKPWAKAETKQTYIAIGTQIKVNPIHLV